MRKTLIQLFIATFLLSAVALWGQSGNGTLSGKITNPQGAAVPNAAVTVTNTTTNVSQRALTGPDGSFTVPNLGPGTYRVDVEMSGYKRSSQQDVQLTVGTNTVNITLQAGSMNETVEVKGSSPSTQTEGGEVGMGIGTRNVRELPVLDRNHQELVGLMQGVTPPTPAIDQVRDPERNRFFSTNGQAPSANLWEADGVDNQEHFRGTAIRVIPNEAIQQVNIATANQTVEKGFNGGAFVSANTPSGTNSFHGDLFEFWSSDLLQTRNFFDSNPDAPRYRYNQFGGALSGPIAKDRTYFYGSYEGNYRLGSNTQLTTVPTAAALGGNFAGIPGVTIYNPNTGLATGTGRSPFGNNVIGSSQINPAARTIASLFPHPDLPGFANNYVANAPYEFRGNRADGRIDHHFSDRTLAFLRYGYTNDWNRESSVLGDVIGAGTRGRLVSQNAIASVQHAFGGSLITDFRFAYNRWDQKLNLWSNQSSLAGMPGFSNFTGANNNLIGINISGLAPIGAPSWVPEHPIDNNFDFVWGWSWVHGPNNFRAGVDIRRIRSDGFLDNQFGSNFGANGTAFFGPGATLLNSANANLSPYASFYNSFAAFLLGAPSQVGISNYFVNPTIRQTQSAFWLGDHVRVHPRITLDFGVRYEVYSPLEPRNPGGASFFDTNTNTFSFAGLGNNNMHWSEYDLDAIAPRFGFAARATNKTVIRGGYGWNYFQPPYMFSGWMAPVYGAVAGVQGGYTVAPFTGTFGPTLKNPVTAPTTLQNGASAGNLPASFVSRSLETPYVQTFSLQVQQEFFWTTMLSVGYVGTLGRHLPAISELNAALPGAGVAGLPFANLGRTASTLLYGNYLTNNYNSLQASLSKGFQGGISFMASYVWSKALGYTGSNGMILSPTNLRANYGPLDYDRTHVLTISHLWELPFGMHGNHILGTILGGWQLNGIFTWASGTPLTVTADPVLCACPGNTTFANLNGSAINQNGLSYLNASAFSAPAFGQFGNIGRGAVRGPDEKNYDMSLFKNFHVHDRFNLQLRGEAFNLTNTPRFASPVTNINSPSFGMTTSTINGAFGRQVDVAARLLF